MAYRVVDHQGRETRPDYDVASRSDGRVQISLIAYLTAGAFLGLAYFDYFYNLVLIVVISKLVLKSHTTLGSAANVAPTEAIRVSPVGTGLPVVRRL